MQSGPLSVSMKILLDFLPLAFFYLAFNYGEAHREWAAAFTTSTFGFMVAGGTVGPDEAPVLLATVVVVLATLVQVLILKLRRQKIDAILWISFALVVVLGALTVYLHSKIFIKWKVTGVYWAMALGFWTAERFFKTNVLKTMLADLTLPEPVWKRLNLAWILFSLGMGSLNLLIVYTMSDAAWANFKAFGTIGLTLVFTLAQGVYLAKHLPDEPAAEPGDKA